jgi:hypothetical protein
MAETIFVLVLLSMAIASISWTITQEEIFREPREWCGRLCKTARSTIVRKFFYVFTCEYCFSHWVALIAILITGFRLVYDDWRGLLVAFFVLPWLANQWMSVYRRLRVEIKKEDAVAEKVKREHLSAKKPPR